MANLKDSGARTTFESGAQREVEKSKGRHDLLPLDVLAVLYASSTYDEDVRQVADGIFSSLHHFVYTGDMACITDAIWTFIEYAYHNDTEHALLCLAIHYGDGAEKYAERNWEQGLPLSSFLQSAVRHFIKWIEKWEDEPHDRAFLWNLFGIIRTLNDHNTVLYDLPFYTKILGEEKSNESECAHSEATRVSN